MAETGAKRCSRCGETGLSDRFPPNPRMQDGLSSWCRRCHAAAVQRWRDENPEKAASYNVPGGSSMSRGRASSAANRSSRDVPTRSFARTCADGTGRAARGRQRRERMTYNFGGLDSPRGRRQSTSGLASNSIAVVIEPVLIDGRRRKVCVRDVRTIQIIHLVSEIITTVDQLSHSVESFALVPLVPVDIGIDWC
jgi:hypothetical protein